MFEAPWCTVFHTYKYSFKIGQFQLKLKWILAFRIIFNSKYEYRPLCKIVTAFTKVRDKKSYAFYYGATID